MYNTDGSTIGNLVCDSAAFPPHCSIFYDVEDAFDVYFYVFDNCDIVNVNLRKNRCLLPLGRGTQRCAHIDSVLIGEDVPPHIKSTACPLNKLGQVFAQHVNMLSFSDIRRATEGYFIAFNTIVELIMKRFLRFRACLLVEGMGDLHDGLLGVDALIFEILEEGVCRERHQRLCPGGDIELVDLKHGYPPSRCQVTWFS